MGCSRLFVNFRVIPIKISSLTHYKWDNFSYSFVFLFQSLSIENAVLSIIDIIRLRTIWCIRLILFIESYHIILGLFYRYFRNLWIAISTALTTWLIHLSLISLHNFRKVLSLPFVSVMESNLYNRFFHYSLYYLIVFDSDIFNAIDSIDTCNGVLPLKNTS